MSKFETGQKVEATVKAQGMNKGEQFTVIDWISNYTEFGGFVTYTVKNEAKELQITNAQFVLKAA